MTRSTSYTIIRHYEGLTGEARWFDVDTASELSGMHRDLILELTRAALIPTAQAEDSEDEWRFDECAIYRLRQIDALQRRHQASLRVIREMLRLMDQLEEAQRELHRLRELAR